MSAKFLITALAAFMLVTVPLVNSVSAANDQAVSRPGQATVIDVLANDGLPDGTRVIKVEGAEHGKTETTGEKTRVIYTPESGFKGEDHFVYSAQPAGGEVVSGIVAVSVTAETDPKEEQLAKTGSVLLLLLVLAILLESGLSVVFNWRPFVVFGESRGLKTPIAIFTAAVFVFSYEINAVEEILEAFVSQDLENSWPGMLITSFIVAGGSGLIFQMFEKFGLRNPLARQRAAQQAREQSRLKIVVDRKKVPTTQPILVKVDGSMIGSIGPDKTDFGGLLGHVIEAGIKEIELSGIDSSGVEAKESKKETIAPGATVTLSFIL